MTLSVRGGSPRGRSPIQRSLILGWLGLFYGAVAALVLSISLFVSPEAIAQGEPWRALGFELRSCVGCALCGMSRAFSSFSHGQLLLALQLNPLVVVAWPAALVAAVGGPFAFLRRHRSS